jgi:dihydrolipoamide dehydrogenase
VAIGKVPYGAVGAGTILGDRSGLVKLVADAQTRELLGAHIVGSKSAELLQELVTARALMGGVGDVARDMHGHPTLSEAVLEAARAADRWLVHG